MSRDDAATVILERILAREGGIADIHDGAGLTRFGQTPNWLRTWGLRAPETAEQALANYREWLTRTKLIGLCDLPDALADVVIDFAVNAGHWPAIMALQHALRVKADGVLGPLTQTAIDTCRRRKVAAEVLASKIRYHGELVTGNPIRFAQFAKGWAYRDAGQVAALVED